MRARVALFALLGALCFAGASTIHALTFAGVSGPAIFFVALGARIAWGAMVGELRAREEPRDVRSLLARLPGAYRALAYAVLAYFALSLAAFFATHEGSPQRAPDGSYVLKSRQRVIRALSEPEYRRACAAEERPLSAGVMFFALVPALYFAVVRRDAR